MKQSFFFKSRWRSVFRKMICQPIRWYQYLLSPIIGPCCRFYPSCSEYAVTVIQYHGLAKGLWLACRRLLRCHPWANGGIDAPLSPDKEKF